MKASIRTLLLVAAVGVALGGCGGAETRKAHYLEKGEKFFAEANYEKASVEFRNALQIAPNDPEARYRVGRVAEKLDNPRDAFGHYQAAIDADPTHAPSRAALARLYLFGGLPERALELGETGLQTAPDDAALLTVRGAARAQLGNIEGAFADAEAAVQRAPDDEYAVALLASLYRQSSRSDKAMEVVSVGIEKIPQSVDLRIVLAELMLAQEDKAGAKAQLAKVIELQPRELAHRYRLARLELLSKDLAGAENTLRDAVKAAPDSIEAKMSLADFLASNNQYEKAEDALQEFVRADDDNAALQLALGRFYESHKKLELAEATYAKVVKEQGEKPDGLVARNRMAALMLQRNDVAGATKLIDEVLAINPRDNDALVMRGNLLLAKGDAPGAIADLRAVLRDQPNATPVMRALARAHLQNKETALAEETLKAASQANPTDRVLRLEVAQLLAQTNRPEQARPVLEKLVTEAPDDLKSIETLFRVQVAMKDFQAAHASAASLQTARPEQALGFYLDGIASESERKLDDAYKSYARALELEPNVAEPLVALTRIDVARSQTAVALARLDKALAAQPDNVIVRNLKGEVQLSSGDAPGAIATFKETIAKADTWWTPYRGLALSHLTLKHTDEAIAAFEAGLAKSREPGSIAADLAALYERLARSDDAIRVYETLLTREPSSVAAANNLAMLLVSYRDDKASLQRAAGLADQLANVEDAAVLNTRGWVMFKNGEVQNSVPLLQKAVDKSPQSPLMRYHLGMAQLRAGNREAARENLEAAVAGGKPFAGAKEAQAALEEIKRAG